MQDDDDDNAVCNVEQEVELEPPIFRRFHTWPLIEEKPLGSSKQPISKRQLCRVMQYDAVMSFEIVRIRFFSAQMSCTDLL